MKETLTVEDKPASPAGPESANLKKRVITGSVWTIASYGASQVLRLGGNLIFAKLLFPEAFGLMALVSIFIQGLGMFSDIGIGPSIIQSRRGEELAFLNTAWTIQVGRGFVLWVVSAIGAGPFAAWYGEPQLAALIPVAALSSIISGFTSTRLFTGSRRISLVRITVIDFASQTIGLVSMVVWCFVTRSVWAIVFGSLIGAAAKTVLSHVALSGERNRITIERTALRELMSFGRWIFVSTALSFLTGKVDSLLLGKFVPIGDLGVYSIAIGFASLPGAVALMLTGGVLFPLLAHHSRSDPVAYERALFSARAMILKGALFLLAGLALVSPSFFRLLYDARYAEGAWIAQLLTIPMWIWMLMLTADRAVLAVGDSLTLAISNGVSLATKIAACIVAFHFFGLAGFILGLGLGNIGGHIPIVIALRRQGVHILWQDVPYTAVAIAVVGGGVLLQRWAATGFSGVTLIVIEIALAAAILLPLGMHAFRHARQSMAKR